ncbi:MAG TPA: 30S ribosomal protein S15 [Phycisphaerales bacterium]|nr:30S ribosomal protein S15 [Phycisphaerales bacterium]
MPISSERRLKIVSEYRTHGADTGSPEVQVALLTEDIRDLTEHMKVHQHDYATKRGLMAKVSRRTRLTNYLKRIDRERYLTLIQRLGLRK